MGGPQPAVEQYSAADWRVLISEAVSAMWPQLADGGRWIEAQVHVESRGNPRATSPSGAMGLLQLMPGTAEEVLVQNPYDPSQNLAGGIKYLRQQFERLAKIPSCRDRLLWSFAAYNCGFGYVGRALSIAQADTVPFWWSWEPNWRYLAHREAIVAGRCADYRQVRAYVQQIQGHYITLGGTIQ